RRGRVPWKAVPRRGPAGRRAKGARRNPRRKMTMTSTQLTSTLPLSRLRRVTDYIHEHLDQHLTLAHLGAVVFMSPYHFARLFQHSTGLPPHRFVVRARIDHAAALLAAPDLSISQISRVV